MTPRFFVSPRARGDMDDAWEDAERRSGSAAAEAYIRQLWHRIETVAVRPEMGQACHTVRAGYYAFAAGSHWLFYRLTPEGMIVVRLLAARVDLARQIWGRAQED